MNTGGELGSATDWSEIAPKRPSVLLASPAVKKSVFVEPAGTVAEAYGPKFGDGKRLARVERQRAFKCSGRDVIGIDLGEAGGVCVVVPDEQVAAKLAPIRGRDGEPPRSVQIDARPCR